MLTHVLATRYVTPLREGGSLPGLMEADDLGTYVVKFRGAGQGRKALIAEVISAGIARALGLRVPDLVTVEVDVAMASGEPDQEVQDLLRNSAGRNLGVDFLPGALDYDPIAFPIDAGHAGQILWFDALVGNMDRSRRNPNLLQWRDVWLIDHGATLTFHHRWESAAASDARSYDASDHVLIGSSPDVAAADRDFASVITVDLLRHAVEDVPHEWLAGEPGFAAVADVRAAYVERIMGRFMAREAWLPGLTAPQPQRRQSRGRPDWLGGSGD